MHLNYKQQRRFWSDWKAACLAQGWTKPDWTPAQIENERYSLLRRAGFESLRDVDHLEGFDRVLAELAALAQPNSVDAQLRQANMPATRAAWTIAKIKGDIAKVSPGNNYLRKVMLGKFGTEDWNTLSRDQLIQLLATLRNRKKTREAKAAAAPACRVEAPSEDGSGSDSALINTSLQGGASDPTPAETVSTVSADPSEPF